MKLTTNTIEETMISEAKTHYESSIAALRSSCEHALLAGLRLIWLHEKMGITHGTNQYSKVDVPRDTSTFDSALARIGIAKRTAYRWMNACGAACVKMTLFFQGDDLGEVLPEPGSTAWHQWESALHHAAQGTSLNRLILGADREGAEMQRISVLVDAAEEGRQRAVELLEAVDQGKYTFAQAIKALGSQEAYDALRASGAEKVRRDPVYLDLDPQTGELTGLVPRSLTTIRNAFQQWDDLPAPARRKVRDLWLEVAVLLPEELVKR